MTMVVALTMPLSRTTIVTEGASMLGQLKDIRGQCEELEATTTKVNTSHS